MGRKNQSKKTLIKEDKPYDTDISLDEGKPFKGIP